jgi:hypothetical protein
MNANEIAALFDVDLDAALADVSESNDYVTSKESTVPFEKKLEDMQSIIPDDLKVSDIIKEASKKTKEDLGVQKKPEPKKEVQVTKMQEIEDDNDVEFEESADVEDEVMKDINKYKINTQENEVNEEINETENKELISVEKTVIKTDKVHDSSNPLDLNSADLIIYNKIRDKFPQFNLTLESRVFKDFYKCKFEVLKYLLYKFPLLDSSELIKEIQDIKFNLTADADSANPELISGRLDVSHKMRVRVSHVLVNIYEQIFSWERHLEILRAKLWKDHDLKGAHKRDGLIIEHLMDMERYYSELTSIQHIAQHADNILKAASESLSRQLSCMNMKTEMSGVYKNDKVGIVSNDSIKTGTVIGKSNATKVPDDAVLKSFNRDSNKDSDDAILDF